MDLPLAMTQWGIVCNVLFVFFFFFYAPVFLWWPS